MQTQTMQNAVQASPRVRRRRIAVEDFEALADFLSRGFPERSRAYWGRAFSRLRVYSSSSDYGYVLEADGRFVGVVLLLCAEAPDGGAERRNFSSWYVDPAFRSYAPLLIASALQNKQATYINISPAPHTRPLIEAQGFACYAKGQFFAAAGLARPRFDVRVRAAGGRAESAADELGPGEAKLLQDHASFGCLSLVCQREGRSAPFVFLSRRISFNIPAVQLVYCRSLDDFVEFAWPLGVHLLARGFPCVMIDANGPIPGLFGKYYPNKSPRYFRGPTPPRLGDLAYTELPMFGV